jgi:NAD(P)-dependent dehydrogenase (short-subunit alcohol dehydrogenase family)
MTKGLFDLAGKVGLVTGGNGGLGLAFARGLAKQGADVIIWGRNAEKNAEAERELQGFGVRTFSQVVDVASEEAVDAAFDAAVAKFGRIDCVIPNAGIANRAPSTAEMTTKAYEDLLAINLHGAFYTLRAAAKYMTARSEKGDAGGSIILCGSGAALGGVPGLAHYAIAKGGLAALTRVMSTELGKHQVRVNMVLPGHFKTELGGKKADAVFDALGAQTPLLRAGDPAELEGIVAYLASDAARYHTGDMITIDGGWRASYF